jgi:hypothetical protein
MSTVEKNVTRGITNFIKYLKSDHGLDISAFTPTIGEFINQFIQSRKATMNSDTFYCVCEFLEPPDIISLTTTSHEFMYHYPSIWGIIQQSHYPLSLIPASDYMSIRKDISLERYYHTLISLDLLNVSKVARIVEEELAMVKLSNIILNTPIVGVNARTSNIVNRCELRSRKSTCDQYYISLTPPIQEFFNSYQFVSDSDCLGNRYYTIKLEIGCRLSGLDPIIDSHKTKILRDWITGESRHKSNCDIDNNDDEYSSSSDDDSE